jgi:hypothetical protein
VRARLLLSLVVVLGFDLGATGEVWAGDPMSTSPEQAFSRGEIPSARAVAMGGALTALGVSTTSLYINPANMPFARVYHIEAFGAFSPEAQRQTYGAAIVDSVLNSNRISGGLGGAWSQMDPSATHRVWTDIRAAMALPLGDYLALGMTGRWLHVDQATAAGPLGHSLASDGTSTGSVFSALTFDAGATARLGDSLRIGIVGHNLTNPATALAPVTGSLGLGFTTANLVLEADGLLDFTTYKSTRGQVMFGGEAFLAERYALRAGWRYDAGTTLHTPSIGLGYIDPRWSIELAAAHDLTSDHAGTTAVLALRYFYDPTGTTGAPDSFAGSE